MSRDIMDYLMDIKNECDYLSNRTHDITFEEFLKNEDLKKAFVRSLEIIGEATKKIPDDIRKQYPQIKWKSISGMRDILIHEYFGVDYQVVWKTVTTRIPELKIVIDSIINALKSKRE